MSMLPIYKVGDPMLDRLPKAALRAIQSERLRTIVRYCFDNTEFWRRKFDEAGLAPSDVRGIEDLRRIPFCTKAELQADQAAHPPFGSYVGSDRTQWCKVFSTSGTTGKPLRRIVSRADWQKILDRFTRISPVAPGDIVIVLGPVDDLFGATAGAEGLAHAGAIVVPAGRYDTRRKIELICELRPTVVTGTASYLMHVAEVAREMGVDLASLGIKGLSSVGEPGAAIPATRQRLAAVWGAFVGDGYGLTEILPLGGGCLHRTSTHIPDDLVITEIVDPKTGVALPTSEPGEVVFTNLICDTHPLLRYRTGDVARTAPDEICDCGFTGTILSNSIEGRVDDMVWFKGINLYPSVIENAIRSVEDVGEEFEILIEGDYNPRMTVRVELPAGREANDALRDAIKKTIRTSTGFGAEIELLPPASLPRTDGRKKARRVRDIRNR